MFPGTHARTSPDKPAVVMVGTGETLTYGELEERSVRLAHVLHDAGLRPGDSVALLSENSPRYHECLLGGAAQRALPHRRQRAPLAGGAGLHPARLRSPGRDRLGRARRGGGGAGTRGPRAGAQTRLRRSGRGLRRLRGRPRRRVPRAVRGPAGRRGHALLLRHHRAAEGDPGRRCRTGRSTSRATSSWPSSPRCTASTRTPSTSPPRRSTTPRRCGSCGLIHAIGGHRRGDAALRRRGGAVRHREVPRHAQPVGADDVRADAQAARGDAGGVRPVQHAGGHPRRGPVPGRGQAADDRVVGAGPARVLRGDRGGRRHPDRPAGVAGATRARSAGPGSACCTSATSPTRTSRSCPSARPGWSTSSATRCRSATTTTRRRPARRSTRSTTPGPPRATSATSTRRASCSSPTAGRS